MLEIVERAKAILVKQLFEIWELAAQFGYHDQLFSHYS
jgi:hypothetical protein